MKILHCCLANFYIDNYAYQENILPRMHKLQGHDVAILASTETYINNTQLGYIQSSAYTTEDDIPITRLPYVSWLPHILSRKMRIYSGIKNYVEAFAPDIIFLHDAQFVSIHNIVSYVKKHPQVKVFVDSHTDYVNSATSWLSMNILHKVIYRWCIKQIEPYTIKFYGTLPLRNIFLVDVYNIPEEKVELLPLGVDLTNIDLSKKNEIKKRIREELGFEQDDFVIITGGKIDLLKNIHLLLDAVSKIKMKKIKLILFGSINSSIEPQINQYLLTENRIRYLGWLDSSITSHYLLASDIAIYPGTHSVLWEQTVGLGIPCIFKKWKGIEHVDLGGNCMFLENITADLLQETIEYFFYTKTALSQMKDIAERNGPKTFSYYEIAKKAIKI
ncbi:glycosyltransferase [Bacteroidales bacterium OttesenSCG-928-K03]|nr:glycosyltransferase [Odoribacter sp. OttesenSCG-928-L07]MDL2239381.1 glycosyltransferase [Bacteroidales bacterium OttesenSCG-928-L14]MDL2242724.1 glycosyltransferase [Bacteroidales bacterium OttesenSCG-928-K03]